MIGAEKAVTQADLVGPSVILVVADEDVDFFVQRHVVNVAQPRREEVQVVAIGPAAQYAASFQHKLVSFRSHHVAAVIAEGKVKPTIMAHDDAIRVVQADLILLGRQSKPADQVATLVGFAGPLGVAQHR